MRLQWDQTGERYYETGVRQGVLYPCTAAGAYDKGVAWSGLTAVTESPSGAESNPQYADDIKYLDLRSLEQFGGTIEAFTYPDEFGVCDGSAEPVPGVQLGQQTRRAFGLCYRTVFGNDTEFDEYGYKLHIVYGATASPSERSYGTINESPEAAAFSWEFSTTPVKVEGYKPVSCITITSTKVDSEKLAALEDILYGTDGSGGGTATDPRLPTPAEVIAALT